MPSKGEVTKKVFVWIGAVSLVLTGLIVYFSAVTSSLVAVFIFAFFFGCLSVYVLLRMVWYRGMTMLASRNLKVMFGRVGIFCILLVCSLLFSFWLYDPLVSMGERVFTVGMLVILTSAMAVLALAVLGKKVTGIVVGIVCFISVCLFALVGNWLYINFAHQPTVADDASALVKLKEGRLAAMACLGQSEVLQSPYKSMYCGRYCRWSNRENVCAALPARWAELPDGWRYMPAADTHISDGTFSFSAYSRKDNWIVCSEKDCQLLHPGTVADDIFVVAVENKTETIYGKVVARGDINQDGLEDAIVQSSSCGASCAFYLTVVFSSENNSTKVLENAKNTYPAFEPAFMSSSAGKSQVDTYTIDKDGVISLTGYRLCYQPVPGTFEMSCNESDQDTNMTVKYKYDGTNLMQIDPMPPVYVLPR